MGYLVPMLMFRINVCYFSDMAFVYYGKREIKTSIIQIPKYKCFGICVAIARTICEMEGLNLLRLFTWLSISVTLCLTFCC